MAEPDRMTASPRSLCPVNLSLEVFGDRWTLLVLRDIVFAGKRHYRELLTCDEGISTNILADRLKLLVHRGLLTRSDDPGHKQKALYNLTERAITLVPVFVQIGVWGRRQLGADDELSRYAEVLEDGGPPLWESFMDDLREAHLGAAARHHPPGHGPSFELAVERARTGSRSTGGA
ncbi:MULTISPECIES: winged helix-turn-helix transcriptional regulator [Prauserella salsuginis group]|uniref:DNA-binding HxlR family transcriptional regulator n=2 Tax=Prauserella salsuginis group TaxID=2893672 RepID=A0A839XVZ1_9PSEU|nr:MULTISPECIES: helix-turn-helix domain-containing protein [Prauserella salsuginis group]MBB3664186.1 DNA-binding HxlR family transcriptional regulator [Prauserella sediminis]